MKFKRPHKNTCIYCGKEFFSCFKIAKYCNRRCNTLYIREHSYGGGGINRKSKPRVCLQCKKEYYSSTRGRKYCSYDCHLKSDGPLKAGMASMQAKIIMKYGVKKDANHKEIQDALRKAGAFVKDISSLGCGAPDLVVWTGSAWEFIEIKNPKTSYGRRGFNKNQLKWQEEWTGAKVYLIKSIDEALAWWKEVHKEKNPPNILRPSSAVEALTLLSEDGKYLHPNGMTNEEAIKALK